MDKNDKEELEMCRILIFSGTTEGNQIAKAVCRLPAKVYVSVATEYGKVCAEEQSEAEIIAGRMDREEIQEFFPNIHTLIFREKKGSLYQCSNML